MPIDYSDYATLDDVAHDHVVSDRLYDDFGGWCRARGLPDKMPWEEEAAYQREFLQHYLG